jgi:nucleoid-associated protein YgaU
MGRSRSKHSKLRRMAMPAAASALVVLVAGLAVWAADAGDVRTNALPSAHALVPATSQPACSRKHVLRRGETLESIANEELGTAMRWQEISAANRERLDAAGLWNGLEPGDTLLIPMPCSG